MKVLYLTPGVFDKGGISRYDRFQIMALRELVGAENVFVVSLMGSTGSVKDLETRFSVNWHGVSDRRSWVDKMAFAGASFFYAARYCPSLIWSGHMHYSALAWALGRFSRARVVVQIYGTETWTPRPERPDISLGFRRCDFVVSDAYFTARYVEEAGLRPKGSVEVIWGPVDTESFAPGSPARRVLEEYGIPSPGEHFNILTLGRLSKATAYKGYLRLLEVFPRLPEKARLIYGGGGGDLRPVLEDRAVELGIRDRVIFTGFIDEQDLPDVYRSASVFCLIADWGPGRGEGGPLTALEAAACGVPILVGNQDGSQETVEHGVSGFALDPFDLDAIAAHLIRLAKDENLRRAMGQAAREKMERERAYPVFRERMRQFMVKAGLLE
ncbi:MAG: glycosyltransferase family 4 protein [Candidatus Methanomethyliaceae archaeon]